MEAMQQQRQPELTQIIGSGDFTGVYETEFRDAVRLAYLLTGSDDVAVDVAQDAFVALHRKWDSVADPRAYVRRSVVNGATSWKRRQARKRSLPIPPIADAELDADELGDVLARLPARQRAAVVLRYYDQCSHDDIAQTLGCRPGTVGSLLNRALATLKEELS